MPWALVALWLLCLCGAPIVASAAQAASAVHAPETATSAPAAAAQTVVEVFVREGCPHCAKAEKFLAGLARERPDLNIVVRDVSRNPPQWHVCRNRPRTEHRCRTGAGLLCRRATHLRLLGRGFHRQTRALRAAGPAPPPEPVPPKDRVVPHRTDPPAGRGAPLDRPAFEVSLLGRTITLDDVGLPAFTIAMGLLDGLNPCSMWVLILMISLLATLNDRKRMLAIAGTFVLVEGVAYFVFMAAWLNLFLLIGLSRASQLVIAAIAIAAG
jgi:thiol-disulfide isomerase/thioredoxin